MIGHLEEVLISASYDWCSETVRITSGFKKNGLPNGIHSSI